MNRHHPGVRGRPRHLRDDFTDLGSAAGECCCIRRKRVVDHPGLTRRPGYVLQARLDLIQCFSHPAAVFGLRLVLSLLLNRGPLQVPHPIVHTAEQSGELLEVPGHERHALGEC